MTTMPASMSDSSVDVTLTPPPEMISESSTIEALVSALIWFSAVTTATLTASPPEIV